MSFPSCVPREFSLVLRQGPAAAAEVQRIPRPSRSGNHYPLGALARFGLARAYTLQAQSAQGADANAARA